MLKVQQSPRVRTPTGSSAHDNRTDFLALTSSGLVGLSLGLIGGGGSILVVPLMVYVVGVSSPHVAIGTSAVGVAMSALINLFGHARDKNVKWPCATVFAIWGIAGAALGAALGTRTHDPWRHRGIRGWTPERAQDLEDRARGLGRGRGDGAHLVCSAHGPAR